jgi:hypothetical protein
MGVWESRFFPLDVDELQKYQFNSLLMTKSFLSSSIDRKITELFLYQKEKPIPVRNKIDGSIIKLWVMFIYHIKHQRTALHIEDISQYANEGEILIMPYSVFQIKNINNVEVSHHLSNGRSITEIELEESIYVYFFLNFRKF